ncbi:MAG: efflux RND transporter periplasmic adaptor subunit [Prolixibacteraceae bacterium]
MNKYFLIAIAALLAAACHSSHSETEGNEIHKHTESLSLESEEYEHEAVKVQYTAYTSDYELFAEADAFIVGESANVLSHFSHLPSFKALEKGSMTIRLEIGNQKVEQTLDKPTRKGIYSFDLFPNTQGEGQLTFEITNENGISVITVPNVKVFASDEDALHSIGTESPSMVNTTVFTKEQSWKIDFATEQVRKEHFGQVIKTSGQIQSASTDELIISAKTNGFVQFSNGNISEGVSIKSGQSILTVSGNELAENNAAVRFSEAKNNFEKTKQNYDRLKTLAADKIVSEKELLEAKNQFLNAEVLYETMNKQFNANGQNVKSTSNGFVKHLFVKNGEYVNAGQALLSVSKNEKLLITADIQQKYASVLSQISTANISTPDNQQSFTLEELNGKVLSYGRTTNNDNFLIPVTLQIDNTSFFVPGSFVKVYLKTITNTEAITIPNSALLEEQGNFYAFVQLNPELFEKKQIKLGTTDGIRTAIPQGLNENDRIVSKGAVLLKLTQSTGKLDPHAGHIH